MFCKGRWVNLWPLLSLTTKTSGMSYYRALGQSLFNGLLCGAVVGRGYSFSRDNS